MKNEIIAGTIQAILKQGIAQISLRPLARALNTSDRMILYYFKNKDELMTAAVEQLADTIVQQIRWELSASTIRNAKTFIQAAWDVFLRPANKNAALVFYEIEFLSLRQPEKYQKIARSIMLKWKSTIAEGLRELGLKGKDADARCLEISSELTGLFLHYLVTGDDMVFDSFKQLTTRIEQSIK